MSWLARSIAKTLLPSDDEEEEQGIPSSTTSDTAGDPQSPPKGVKEDISELTQTLTRQFRGFASFLAPPPQSQSEFKTSPGDGDDVEASDSSIKMPGIRSDFAEIGGRVRSGISKISEHVAVSEIAKIASSFLPLGSDEDEDAEHTGVVGVTEEVLMFVENISLHPGTWLDFPLLEEECDGLCSCPLTVYITFSKREIFKHLPKMTGRGTMDCLEIKAGVGYCDLKNIYGSFLLSGK